MSYLAKYLDRKLKQVKLIRNIPAKSLIGKVISKIHAVLIAIYLFIVLGKDDKVVFFEYLTKGAGHQDMTAKIMRLLGCKSYIYGLVHLSGNNLIELYNAREVIVKKLDYADEVLVFGASLQQYIQQVGYKKKVTRTFHYVDSVFYKPANKLQVNNGVLDIICIGNLKRNFSLLKEIIVACPDVRFHICMGGANLTEHFTGLDNVKLYGFLSEDELLALMQSCSISLSVLEDTIGSNVITTSLAVGMAQVVSDVGSIRNYCSIDDTIFCSDTDSYTNAIKKLDNDRALLLSMQCSAFQKSGSFSKEFFLEDFIKITS
jgi:glycosyltransferase involved in cell wall biosynthesis